MTFSLFTEWTFWLWVALVPVAALALVRALRIIGWALSLSREVRALEARAKIAPDHEAAALGVVVSRCRTTLRSFSPDLPDFEDLHGYLTEVAAAFHPEAPRPELRVSVGHLIRTLNRSLDRFDAVLERPGLARLRRVRIATVKTSTRRLKRVTGFSPVRWYLRFRRWVSGMNVFRLLLLPDPVSWLITLSGNLSLMVLGKCLLADLYLFVGTTALELYGSRADEEEALGEEPAPEAMEEILQELEGLDDAPPAAMDPALAPLRKRITGVSALFHPTPGLTVFGKTVTESAELLAQKHFPEADSPLDEARIGPILERTRHLLAQLGRGESLPVAGRLFRVRLDTLATVHRYAGESLPKSLKEAVTQGKKAYGWLKWPLTAYRLTARGGLLKVAAGLGWRTAGKGVTLFLYGRLYDYAMEEVDSVMRRSKEKV
ncbi:hypothetical protein [Desulfoluna butyratoxydans]|uniref:Uncharacterized protein n=1 Tax=Desulfoluna butyratoxydans TaxID=231438 RepID=A0A4U8YR80_9BACT|nr:hypothetical protein [Desulfoluna butyratoxydans]VFQ43763.1 hypothetical protein MSL71_14040 [Desulfoluna butyratoxydans]